MDFRDTSTPGKIEEVEEIVRSYNDTDLTDAFDDTKILVGDVVSYTVEEEGGYHNHVIEFNHPPEHSAEGLVDSVMAAINNELDQAGYRIGRIEFANSRYLIHESR